MGIFGDIAEGLGDIIAAGAPIAQSYLMSRAPAPVVYSAGGPPGGVSPYAVGGPQLGGSPLGFPVQTAGFTDLALQYGPMAVGAVTSPEAQTIFGSIADYLQGQTQLSLYRSTQRTSPVPTIQQQNPVHPERIDVWEYAGRPVLYSRDLRTCRRVQKIARRARRAGGR